MARKHLNIKGRGADAFDPADPTISGSAKPAMQQGAKVARLRLSLRLPPESVDKLARLKQRRRERGRSQTEYSFDALVKEAIALLPEEV